MVSVPDDLSVERNHPDHPGEAVVVDSVGTPIIFASAQKTDVEILQDLETDEPRHGYRTPESTTEKLAQAHLDALKAYAEENGRCWKSRLSSDWQNGRSFGLLQQVRNLIGPSGLQHLDLSEGN